jgi:hypothetical protein
MMAVLKVPENIRPNMEDEQVMMLDFCQAFDMVILSQLKNL